MHTTSNPILSNIFTCIGIPVLIFSSILSTSYGFVASSVDASAKYRVNVGPDWDPTFPPDPDPDTKGWWENNLFIVLALLAVIAVVGFFFCLTRLFGNMMWNHGSNDPIITGPFRPQELSDSRRSSAEFHNNVMASWQDGFRNHQRPVRGHQGPGTLNEQLPGHTADFDGDTIDQPPPYAAAVQNDDFVLPRKINHEGISFDSDVSTIESPPSYFMVQDTRPPPM